MSMVVQHNMQAANANRMLGIVTGSQAKSTEKLSSGYKINRAADDAAGLSISEKMRKQIRGLSRASDNAQDGISCVQTAEGALTEVTSMLQRMNELAVQAANGTNSEDDRAAIQAEIEQLTTEIDRVSETTKFNETYLLKGKGDATTTSVESGVQGTTKAGKAVDVALAEATGNKFSGKITSTLGKGTEDSVTVKYTDKLGDAQEKEVKFKVGADAAETAANIAAAINEDEDLKDVFTATADKSGNLSVESNLDYYDLKELGAGAYKITGLDFGSSETGETKLQTKIDTTGAGAVAAEGNSYTLDITNLKAGSTITVDGKVYTFDPDKTGDTNKTNSFSNVKELLERLGEDYDVSGSLTFGTTVTESKVTDSSVNGGSTTYSLGTVTKNGTASLALTNNTLKLETAAVSSVASAYSDGNSMATAGGATSSYSGSSAAALTGSVNSYTSEAYVGADTAKFSSNLKISLKITKKTEPAEASTESSKEALALNFHVGADSADTNKISVEIQSVDATTLGLRDGSGKAINLSTEEGATEAIDTISAALKKISSQRSELGAVQNRLEHTIANLDNVVENTTAAESAIRDTDMAEEMVNYSKNNILAQAGQSMLAQANQANQGVLSLLG